jgi:hypothetical protein
LRKHLYQLVEQENGRILTAETQYITHIAVKSAAFSYALFLAIYPLQGRLPTLTNLYDLFLAALMLMGCIMLLGIMAYYGRYRTSCTLWAYLLSRKRIPRSHAAKPLPLTAIALFMALIRRFILVYGRRRRPHHRPKNKAPILLFQQAALLLAP